MPVSNRHIEENLNFLSKSTGFLLRLTIKARNKCNEVLYAEIPGSFDRQKVSFSKPMTISKPIPTLRRVRGHFAPVRFLDAPVRFCDAPVKVLDALVRMPR